MPSLRVDERLATTSWPALGAVSSPRWDGRTTLVVCAGFEDRAFESLRRLAAGGARGGQVISVDYRPTVEQNRIAELMQISAQMGADQRTITYDRQDPAGVADTLFAAANTSGDVVLDVSGMSRLLIVQLLSGAIRRGIVGRIRVAYTEAAGYPPTEAEVRKNLADQANVFEVIQFISAGVFGITVVPELSSAAMQGYPMHLVAFPTFNPTQLAALRAEIQAAFTTIINGRPPGAHNAWRRDAIRQLNRLDAIQGFAELDASTLDYRETLRHVLEIYSRCSERQKIVVAPTGSKMQSVAVGVACGFLHDLQVVYPTPRDYPTPANYTTGVGTTYELNMAGFESVGDSAGE